MKYALRRIAMLLLTMVIVSLLAFVAFDLISGDPATAMLGTALKLKPAMHVDMEGHLIPVDRVQGRKNP